MIINKLILRICLAITLASSFSFSNAQEYVNKILDKGVLKVAMTGTQPPFSVVSKSDELIGYEVDIANYLANSLEVDLKIVKMEFSKLLGALEKGQVDMVMSGMTITPQRNSKVAFVGPHMIAGKSILTKSDVYAKTRNPSEINTSGVRVAALGSSTSEDFVKGFLPKTTLTTVSDYDEGIKLVIDGKVDVLVADYSICAYSVLMYEEQGLKTLENPLTIEPLGIGLHPGDPLLINLVENFLLNLELSGTLKRTEQKWFEDGGWLLQVK